MVRDSVDVVVSDSPTVPVITGDTLAIDATGARTVFDAVERLVPGAFVTQRGVLGYGISSNGTGQISIRAVLLVSAIVLALLFGVMDDNWAASEVEGVTNTAVGTSPGAERRS